MQEKNERQCLAFAEVSEHDVAELQGDFTKGLAAAEHRAHALGRERDALQAQVAAVAGERDAAAKAAAAAREECTRMRAAGESSGKGMQEALQVKEQEVAQVCV